MTRVSLKEAYDNKDVVAQIYAIRDIAEGAEDTADSAVTTANTASDHVDALVPQVEGAVQNANNASASAQASAQTVAGYENRLSAVEGETAGLDSDLNAVTLRVTTAEGQIVTIQGRVTALETADGQNVKLTGTQTIGGVKHFADSPTAPTTATGLWDVQVANGEKVKNELDNYSPMVRTSGNQNIGGNKVCSGTLTLTANQQYISRLRLRNESMTRSEYGTLRRENQIIFTDVNDDAMAMLMLVRMPNGLNTLTARLYDKTGGYHDTNLASYQDTV